MAEFHSVHRYAAGALFALALHQAHLHQHFLPSYSDFPRLDMEDGHPSIEYDNEDINIWTSSHLGLLRPVFRYLNIDSKAWPGIEQTATSQDAEHHISAFLRILSEEEEENALTPVGGNSEADLAEAVEVVALNITDRETLIRDGQQAKNGSDIVSNNDHSLENSDSQSLCQVAESQVPLSESTSSQNAPHRLECSEPACISSATDTYRDILNCDSADLTDNYLWEEEKKPLLDKDRDIGKDCWTSDLHNSPITSQLSSLTCNSNGSTNMDKSLYPSAGQPVLKENYFGSSDFENEVSTSGAAKVGEELHEQESRETDGKNIDETRASGASETSIYDGAIEEGKYVTQQRKLAVLYELLAGSVTDIPIEHGDTLRLRRGYDARQRVALRLLATWLGIKWTKVAAMEIMVAYSAMAAQQEKETHGDSNEKSKSPWAKWKRGGIIGAAALTGGALLAITGGLAAPAIAAGLTALAPTLGTIVPVIGSSGFAAAAAAAGSTAGSMAVAASFGAAGAGLTGSKMARRTGGVDEFGFEGVGENHQQGRLAVGILISGLINDQEDFTRPWKGQDGDLERYALRWETKNLMALSTAIQDWLTSSITRELMKQGAMLTVLSTLLAALTWPSALLSLTNFIDSKWSVAIDRSDKAGKLLAKILLKGLQGNRPVTLIGFSLGARVIFKCLETLAKEGENGGIVERVVLLGAPLPLETERWEIVRKVVAGRFVNGYSTTDWILGVVFRASLLTQGLAGIQAVNIPGIENVDLTDVIKGHSSYLSKVPEIVQAIKIDNYYPIFPSKICVTT